MLTLDKSSLSSHLLICDSSHLGAAAVTLGANIRTIRERQGLSREAVAAQANLGVATVARLEADQHDPRLGTLAAVALVLGVPMADLLDDGPEAAA